MGYLSFISLCNSDASGLKVSSEWTNAESFSALKKRRETPRCRFSEYVTFSFFANSSLTLPSVYSGSVSFGEIYTFQCGNLSFSACIHSEILPTRFQSKQIFLLFQLPMGLLLCHRMRLKPSIWERIFTTTYTTIDTIGAHGDKMPRERERSFLP